MERIFRRRTGRNSRPDERDGSLGGSRIRRDRADPQAFRTAVEVLRSGEVLLIFPEGARRNKGRWKKRRRLPRPHTGAARIALSARVPLVPIAVIGTDRLTRLGPIRIS